MMKNQMNECEQLAPLDHLVHKLYVGDLPMRRE